MKILQTVFAVVILLVCIHDRIRAVPVEETNGFSSENNDQTEQITLSFIWKTCNFSDDCPSHSQCLGSVCECATGWTTQNDSDICTYEQKSKWTAFLLSFFVGNFGVDWFYLSCGNTFYILAGVLKILIGCGCCGSICRARVPYGDEHSGSRARPAQFFSTASSIWWLVDWIRILVSAFPDGNDVPLYS